MATFGLVFGYIGLLLAGLWAVAATSHELRFLPLAGVALQLLALSVGLASTLIRDWHWQLGGAGVVAGAEAEVADPAPPPRRSPSSTWSPSRWR